MVFEKGALVLFSAAMLIGGASAAALVLEPTANALERAHDRGYAEAMEACKGPTRLERAAKWVSR